jgi:hypothetical protein
MAHKYPMRDALPYGAKVGDYWSQEHMTPQGCQMAGTKEVSGNETNFILRQFPKAPGAAGHAWYVDGAGTLKAIPDGGTYNCLAQKYYVLDARTDAEMTRMGPVSPEPATCP